MPLSVRGVRGETMLRYKVDGSAEMTDKALVRASQRLRPLWCEPD